ncbi:hypothetical protein ACP4OV_028360 [Aristida adscensionis]
MGAADSPTSADAAGAHALLFLAGSSPAPSPPPAAPALSDELSCYSGSSCSSYSGASARSCVSDSARRGRHVDPLRVLAVVASLHRIDPKALAKATSALLQSAAGKKRKGVWIDVNNGDEDEEDQSERSSAVASEGSTVTAAASAGSTATSERCRRPPRASRGEKPPGRADAIMQWLSRPDAAPATETAIRAAVGDNSGTSKALRWLLKREGGLRRAGTGGPADPFVYMSSQADPVKLSCVYSKGDINYKAIGEAKLSYED